MSESAKVTVETESSNAPTPLVVHRHEGRFHFLKVLASVYLSRKFVVSMTSAYLLWRIHWGDIQAIYSFNEPAQLQAFTQLTLATKAILGSIALGYLGFSRANPSLSSYISPMGGGFSGGGGPPVNRSWKSNPEDR